jgi:NADH-quinone oxidoreductase subunit G
MPTITIDGKPVQFEGKKYILQVAQENGLAIPHYCYHAGLSVVASCRICLAEVAQPNPRKGNQPELLPKLVPTCQTPAVDGMIVYTKSPKAVANQKAVMEYLLINHPLDCPVCDQAGECYLQDYSFQYGRAQSRFEEDKIKQPVKDIGPHVKLYADRCIMCSRCVRFTREVTGTGELGVFGRGSKEQIDIFPGKALDNELSANVVDICPVGALLDKDFLFTQRVWFLKETPSIDGLTASGDNIAIHVNEGRVYRVKPRVNPAVNKWWISDEIRYGWKFVHAENRLRQPMRMQYGTQVSCDWARALEDASEGLKKAAQKGPGSLAVLVSPMVSCEGAYLLGKLVRGLDPGAVLGVGPIPLVGTDKTFPGGYTVCAEKCPNSRGVRRALEAVLHSEPGASATGRAQLQAATATSTAGPSTGGQAASGTQASSGGVLAWAEFAAKLADKKTTISAVVVTGNYPNPWATKEVLTALSKKFIVLLDILPSDLSPRADVLFPGSAWVETAGTFENHRNRLQTFRQALQPVEGAHQTGQILCDLVAACGLGAKTLFDAAKIREEMGGAFVAGVQHPQGGRMREPDMVYVEL